MDATVSTAAVVHNLYDVIADERSELVLFDINLYVRARAVHPSGTHAAVSPGAPTVHPADTGARS